MSIISNDYNLQSFNSYLVIRKFTSSDLVNNCLILNDALPGDVIVINGQGKVMSQVVQSQHDTGRGIGVKIDLSGQNVIGQWKVRYNKNSGINANIDFGQGSSLENLIIYSLIFS